MTPQEKMQKKLEQSGIPAKRIHVYGSQIVITAWGEEAAEQWRSLLTRCGFKVRGIIKSREHNIENKNTVLIPSSHFVYRIGARV